MLQGDAVKAISVRQRPLRVNETLLWMGACVRLHGQSHKGRVSVICINGRSVSGSAALGPTAYPRRVPVIVVVGAVGTGKSTLCRYLVNRLLNAYPSVQPGMTGGRCSGASVGIFFGGGFRRR